jgi:hypothetical protein
VLVQQLAQRGTVDELHDDRRAGRGLVILPQPCDVRIVDLGEQPRLVAELSPELRLAEQVVGQVLDSTDSPVASGVASTTVPLDPRPSSRTYRNPGTAHPVSIMITSLSESVPTGTSSRLLEFRPPPGGLLTQNDCVMTRTGPELSSKQTGPGIHLDLLDRGWLSR